MNPRHPLAKLVHENIAITARHYVPAAAAPAPARRAGADARRRFNK